MRIFLRLTGFRPVRAKAASRAGMGGERLPLPCPAKNSRSGSGVRAASVPLRGTRDAAFRAARKSVPQPARSAAFVTALQNSGRRRAQDRRPREPAWGASVPASRGRAERLLVREHRRVGQASPPVTRTTGKDACPTASARQRRPRPLNASGASSLRFFSC